VTQIWLKVPADLLLILFAVDAVIAFTGGALMTAFVFWINSVKAKP
jgi:hypothetical protein